MADPAASIKSIISGKIKADYGDARVPNDDVAMISVTSDDQESHWSQDSDDLGSKGGAGLPTPAPIRRKHVFGNVGLATVNSSASSELSDQRDISTDEYKASLMKISSPEEGVLRSDTPVRPSSRNSTTSCFSTSATKDGIEGKKIHRHGPSPYSNSVISNMINQQQANMASNNLGLQYHSLNENFSSNRSFTSIPQEINGSDVSIKTTNAELNGWSEDKRTTGISNIPTFEPPFTLREKINLLNKPQTIGE